MAKLYAGTSGFAYPAWKPDFYPDKLPQKKFLAHYATRLNAVEINYTFRRLPSASTLAGWVEQTPDAFVFALKAHQNLTHIHRLQQTEFIDIFFKAIDPLRATRRLGPVLFQLPPNFKTDEALLSAFLELIPKEVRCAFEFRNALWLNDRVYAILEKHKIALCLAESDKFEVPQVLTSDFVYLRLRKVEYSVEERTQISERVNALVSGGCDVFVFVKHEETPEGALHAAALLKAAG